MLLSVQHHRSSPPPREVRVASEDDELNGIIAALRSLAESAKEIAVALERLAKKSRRQSRRIGGGE